MVHVLQGQISARPWSVGFFLMTKKIVETDDPKPLSKRFIITALAIVFGLCLVMVFYFCFIHGNGNEKTNPESPKSKAKEKSNSQALNNDSASGTKISNTNNAVKNVNDKSSANQNNSNPSTNLKAPAPNPKKKVPVNNGNIPLNSPPQSGTETKPTPKPGQVNQVTINSTKFKEISNLNLENINYCLTKPSKTCTVSN